MAIRRSDLSGVYSNKQSFPLSHYESPTTIVANTSVDRVSVVCPVMDIDVGGTSLRNATAQTLSVNSDASWDFGQDIGTWTANTEYSVGDWVRPTSGSSIWDGANNTSTSYGTDAMCADTMPTQTITGTTSVAIGYYRYSVWDKSTATSAVIWNSTTTTETLYFSVAKIINKYSFFAPGNGFGPNAWSLHGSLDGQTWTLLDSRENQSSPTSNWYSYYTFHNPNLYNYYKLTLQRTVDANLLALREIKFVEQKPIFYKCTSAGTSLSSEPTWGTTVSGTTAESGGPTWTCYYDYTSATNRAGTDFYIYACQPTSGTTPTLMLSANSTYPHGYTANNSRKIGGFHGLCGSVGTIPGHTLSGYLTGDILPQSVWCLKHRAKAASNAGLVYITPIKKWAAIYLTSGTSSAPTIVFGGTILDTITYFVANDAARVLKMRMPRDSEFAVLAAGSNEGTSILGSADPVTVTAAVDTAGRRMISQFGIEMPCGGMWQWLSESSYRFDGAAAHTHNVTVTGDAGSFTSGNASADVAPAWSWKNNTNSKGQLYTQGTYGLSVITAGGDYNDTTNCGSLGRDCLNYIWNSGSNIATRFITVSIEK